MTARFDTAKAVCCGLRYVTAIKFASEYEGTDPSPASLDRDTFPVCRPTWSHCTAFNCTCRICRYDCAGKQRAESARRKRARRTNGAEPGRGAPPFRSCRGLRIAVTCHPQTRPSPKHVGSALLLFICHPFAPLAATPHPSFFVVVPFHSFRALLLSVSPSPRVFTLPSFLVLTFSLSLALSLFTIDRCHGGTNGARADPSACSDMSAVIVISDVIRTLAREIRSNGGNLHRVARPEF